MTKVTNSENSNDLQKIKYQKMTTEPVQKLVCQMAVPSIISMLISAAYNLADTFFIGKISTEATGAVGVVFSYMAIIQAIGFYFGHGSGNYISRELGAQRNDNAEKMASVGFFSSLICSGALIILGFLFMDPFLRMLGATDTIMPDAKSYFTYILISTPFIMGTFVLNNQLRLQGNAKYGMYGILPGAVLNIILDPVLIFVFDMGIAGAAIATGFSQAVGFVILLVINHKIGLKIKFSNFKPTVKSLLEINAGGLPSLCRQGLASIATICLNQAAGAFGDSAIAAFSVVNRVTFFAMAALLGYGQGFQPVCGYNYGAKLYDRVKKAYWFCIKSSSIVLLCIAVFGCIFAKQIVTVFRADDLELIRIGTDALRYQICVFPLSGFFIISNMLLQTTRKTARATVISVARQGVLFIPILLILSRIFGLTGIEIAQPIADILTFAISIPLAKMTLDEMKNEVKITA